MLSVPALLASATLTMSAAAQTICEELPGPRVVVVHGDTQSRMMADLGRVLRDVEEPITLVHFPRSTCSLVSDVFLGDPINFTMLYEPSQEEVPEWNGTPLECITNTGLEIDLGIAATFISSCSQSVLDLQPEDVKVFRGPVQAYGFVVPEGSLEAASGGITREEAYFVFSGQGATAGAAPWVAEPNPAAGTPSLFIRRTTTSTLLTAAANVAPDLMPPDRWVGYRLEGQEDRSSVVINGVANAPVGLRDATIGILGVELYDRERDRLDILAYQAKGQKYGYYPDSAPSRRDKRNVRDGHYVPWSYTEYLTYVDESGLPLSDEVARVLQMVSGTAEIRLRSADGVPQPFDKDALEVIATNGLIPDCAMQVTRDYDGGDLSLYTPDVPCGCFYETVQDPDLTEDAVWQSKCTECEDDGDCNVGSCLRGYCEVTP